MSVLTAVQSQTACTAEKCNGVLYQAVTDEHIALLEVLLKHPSNLSFSPLIAAKGQTLVGKK